MSTCVVFTSRRWTSDDGDPAAPTEVGGVAVKSRLRTRQDRPGALSQLADERYALTDDFVAVGSRSQLVWFLRARWLTTRSDAERAWLDDVRHTLDERAAIPRMPRRWRRSTEPKGLAG